MFFTRRPRPKNKHDANPLLSVILFSSVIFFILILSASCGPKNALDLKDFNVILISLDTLRADRLHTYGYEKKISPTIDAMAADGVLFENVYAQSNWTLPSHVSMLSGLYPASHGVNNPKALIPERVPLLSEILKRHGYQTASFNAGGFISHRFGFKRGFDFYREIGKREGDIRAISDEMFRWLRENRDHKFFAFFHTYQVHHPYDPPERFREDRILQDRLVGEKTDVIFTKIVEGDDLLPEDYGFLWLLVHSRQRNVLKKAFKKFCADYRERKHADISCKDLTAEIKKLAGRLFYEEEEIFKWYRSIKQAPAKPFSAIDYMADNYDREIIYTDQEIARLLELLDDLGLKENTLILLTSDHGEEFVEHGRWGHRRKCHNYNETIRVPLILYCRGRLPENKRIPANAALVDLVPTILDLVGLPLPDRGDGISLVPLLAGEPPERRALFSESRFDKYNIWTVTVIEDRWKYHLDLAGTLPEELYHTEDDPGETVNLLGKHADLPPSLKDAAEGYHAMISRLTPQKDAELDDQLIEQLKDLGYFE